jgi:arylsulfatase
MKIGCRTRLALLFVASALVARIHGATTQPPNIVFIVADDQSFRSAGFMGDPVVKTPRLDQLAREGVVFTRAAVTTSICMVSRATFLTGQWLSVLRAAKVTPETWPNTWPARLRAAGYFGGHVGKIHVQGQTAAGYDFWAGRPSGYSWIKPTDGGAPVHSIQRDTDEALRFLRVRPKGKPFFLQVAFTVPHAEDNDPRQYLPMPDDESLYENDTVPGAETATDEHWKKLPSFFREQENEGRKRWQKRFDTPEKFQTYSKNYYRLISGMDRGIGRILDELRAQNLEGDTVVVFMADNGYFLGEHGLADKWYAYEESIRVPLVVRDPRLPAERRGRRNDDIVLNVDIAATFCALAGLTPSSTMQGRDFSPLLRGVTPANWRTDFLYQFKWSSEIIPASESVCSKEWKYIRWIVSGSEELFDLRNDPKETRNLATAPSHATELARLRARLAMLKQEVGGVSLETIENMPFGEPRGSKKGKK